MAYCWQFSHKQMSLGWSERAVVEDKEEVESMESGEFRPPLVLDRLAWFADAVIWAALLMSDWSFEREGDSWK